MNKLMISLGLLIAMGIVLLGCGKKADTSKPIEQIQSEVKTLSAKDLEAYAKAYAGEISSLQKELEQVKSRLGQISPAEIFSEKAKGIKDQVSNIASEMPELTKRYEIYLKELQAKGGDLSKVQIQ